MVQNGSKERKCAFVGRHERIWKNLAQVAASVSSPNVARVLLRQQLRCRWLPNPRSFPMVSYWFLRATQGYHVHSTAKKWQENGGFDSRFGSESYQAVGLVSCLSTVSCFKLKPCFGGLKRMMQIKVVLVFSAVCRVNDCAKDHQDGHQRPREFQPMPNGVGTQPNVFPVLVQGKEAWNLGICKVPEKMGTRFRVRFYFCWLCPDWRASGFAV